MPGRLTRLHRWTRTRFGRSQTAVLAALAMLAALAVAAAVDVDWPRWIHNLSDLLQIATALLALLAWNGTRRARR